MHTVLINRILFKRRTFNAYLLAIDGTVTIFALLQLFLLYKGNKDHVLHNIKCHCINIFFLSGLLLLYGTALENVLATCHLNSEFLLCILSDTKSTWLLTALEINRHNSCVNAVNHHPHPHPPYRFDQFSSF